MREKITKEKVDAAYKPLKNFIKENYGLDLKVSQMNKIIDAVDLVNENATELFREKCDVVGCESSSSNGGSQWRDTGYWMLCSKHFSDGHNKLPQPEMKPEAIEREKSRKENGVLPAEEPFPFD